MAEPTTAGNYAEGLRDPPLPASATDGHASNMPPPTPDPPLTPAQARFAAVHRARPDQHAVWDDSLVFVYREESGITHRWLLNADGRVVDSAAFRH